MSDLYDIIIIGAGAAGMTAGVYGVRAGKKVLVLEGKTYGGQIINTAKIENYPATAHISGIDFAKRLYEQAKELGVKFSFEEVSDCAVYDGKKVEGELEKPIYLVKTDEGEYLTKTLIFANGSIERKLNLPNEEEFVGKGISYCATCDGGFFKDKIVAINGGGNTAFWDALYLSNVAKKVYVIHRRNEFRADNSLVEKVSKCKNVEYILNSEIVGLRGKKKLEKLIVVDKTTKRESDLSIDGLFVAIGRVPNNKYFKGFVNLDKEGYIDSNEDCITSRKGVFCAGDTRKKKLNQLVTATADGAIAATGAIEYLNN